MKNIAIISGASSGLGECFVEALVELSECVAESRLDSALESNQACNVESHADFYLDSTLDSKLDSDLESALESCVQKSAHSANHNTNHNAHATKCSAKNPFFQTPFSQINEIWLIARRRERLEALARRFPQKSFKILALDLADMASFTELERILKDESPRISLLISNAGVSHYGSFSDISLASALEIIALNITAATALTKICLPFMQSASKIVEVSSVSSFAPNVNLLVYSASKAYLSAFSLGLGEELRAQNISVTALCPGLMQTEMFANLGQARPNARKLLKLDPKKVALGTLKATLKNKRIYTPSVFYKIYRILARILPYALVLKLARM